MTAPCIFAYSIILNLGECAMRALFSYFTVLADDFVEDGLLTKTFSFSQLNGRFVCTVSYVKPSKLHTRKN